MSRQGQHQSDTTCHLPTPPGCCCSANQQLLLPRNSLPTLGRMVEPQHDSGITNSTSLWYHKPRTTFAQTFCYDTLTPTCFLDTVLYKAQRAALWNSSRFIKRIKTKPSVSYERHKKCYYKVQGFLQVYPAKVGEKRPLEADPIHPMGQEAPSSAQDKVLLRTARSPPGISGAGPSHRNSRTCLPSAPAAAALSSLHLPPP